MAKYAGAILTIAGTIIGAYFGGPVGASLGGLLGGLVGQELFPGSGSTVSGPRLSDTGQTSSNVGAPIPRGWGTFPAGGCIIVQTDLKEVIESETVGGKGGPSQTTETPTYYQTFAIGINDGVIGGIRVIWANGKPIYDLRPQGTTDTAGPSETDAAYKARIVASQQLESKFTLYLGTEDQMPDPGLEAFYGVGNISAFRGLAYIVFTDWENKAEDGNRMPSQWKFEVYTDAEATNQDAGTYANEVLDPWTQGPNPTASPCAKFSFEAQWPAGVGSSHDTLQDALNEVPEAWNVNGSGGFIDYSLESEAAGAVATSLTGGPLISDVTWKEVNTVTLHYNDVLPQNFAPSGADGGFTCGYLNTQWFSTPGTKWRIANGDRWDIAGISGVVYGQAPTSGHPTVDAGAALLGWDGAISCGGAIGSPGGFGSDLYESYDYIVNVTRAPHAPLPVILDPGDLADQEDTLVAQCGIIAQPIDGLPDWGVVNGEIVQVGDWTPYTGASYSLVLQQYATVTTSGVTKTVRYPRDPALPDGHQDFLNEDFWQSAYQNAVIKGLLASGKTYVSGGSATNAATEYPHRQATIYKKGGTLTSKTTGTVAVSTIVGDLLKEAGLQDSDFDVTSIASKRVIGFVRGNVMACRDAITPLAQALFFNLIESNAKIAARVLGSGIVRTLKDEHLGAVVTDGSESQSQQPSKLTSQDAQDVDLPRSIRVHYLSQTRDYETGEQDSPFRVGTESVNDVDVNLPIVMSDTQALQIAQALWAKTWWERFTYTTVIDAEFQELEPVDAIAIPLDGETIRVRIQTIDDALPATRALTLVADDQLSFTSTAVASSVPAVSKPIPINGPVSATYMDMPLLRDADNDSGFYTALIGLLPDSFKSGAIYRSTDNGGTYTRVAASGVSAITGTIVGALPAGPVDVWDYANVITVELYDEADTLSSATEDAVLGGANGIAVGADKRWEIIQFKTATHQTGKIYTLSGLLRGRRGTEWAIGSSVDGDQLVVLSTVIRTPLDLTLVQKPLAYKAVGAGGTLDGTPTRQFTGFGVALKPFSPCFLNATRNAATGDWLITWIRRGRIGQTLQSGKDVPLSEDREDYEVDILGSTGNVVHTLSSSTQSITYKNVDQIADFNSAQLTITFIVYQISKQVGRGYGRMTTVQAFVGLPSSDGTQTLHITLRSATSPPEAIADVDETWVYVSYTPKPGVSGSPLYAACHLIPGSSPTVDDMTTDLAGQLATAFGAKVVVTHAGDVTTLTTTTGTFQAMARHSYPTSYGNCITGSGTLPYAEPFSVQHSGPTDAGSFNSNSIDFYDGNGNLAPLQASGYNVAGTYRKTFKISAYDVEARRALFAANNPPGTFPAYYYCNVSNGVELDVVWSMPAQPSGDADRFSYQVLQGMCDAINASAQWAPYLFSIAGIGTISGRSAANVAVNSGYFLYADNGVFFADASPAGYLMMNTTQARGSATYTGTGRVQIDDIGVHDYGDDIAVSAYSASFGMSNSPTQAGPANAKHPVLFKIGDTFRVTIDGTNYDHVIDSTDTADTYTETINGTLVTFQWHSIMLNDIATQINLDTDYVAHELKMAADVTKTTSLTLVATAGNTPHTVTAGLVGGTVTVILDPPFGTF